MLRLTMEIIPYGDEGLKRSLGMMEISNVGGTDIAGNYRVVVKTEDFREEAFIRRYWRSGGAWNLAKKAFAKMKFDK